jgi:hypothetical protein
LLAWLTFIIFQATQLLCASLVATVWVLVIAWLSGILSFNYNLANLQGRINYADESLNHVLSQLNAFNVHKTAAPRQDQALNQPHR